MQIWGSSAVPNAVFYMTTEGAIERMEWVCGVFSSATAAAWAQAGGSIVSVLVAVGAAVYAWRAYNGTLAQAERVLTARIGALYLIIEQYVDDTLSSIETRKVLVSQIEESERKINPRLLITVLRINGADRLIDLQPHLLGTGGEFDAGVAAFIETCRRYDRKLVDIMRYDPATIQEVANLDEWIERDYKDLRKLLKELEETGESAKYAIEKTLESVHRGHC